MAGDDALWAEVRRLYVETDEPIEVFVRRLGIASRTVLARARLEAWPRRSERRGKKVGLQGPVAPVPPGHPTRAARDALIRRFYGAISAKLSEWETRVSSGEPMTPEERDRLMKELNGMIQGFEKVADVAAGAEKKDDRAERRPRGLSAADTQRMREEIAGRLERLHAAGEPGAGPVDAAPGDDRPSEA